MPNNQLIQRLPRHLKMGELRVFLAVAEHRSFRKAAAELHLSQPAVTKAVATLEATLDAKLFDRMAHGVELTVQGASFAPRARAVFDELRRAAQDLMLVSSGAKGHLRVGTVAMPAVPFLPVAVKRLMDQHPEVFVSIVEGLETELMDRVRKRDIELAILRLALIDLGEDLQVAPLFDERLCVIAAKDHPLAGRADLSWDELQRQRWVIPPADCYFYEHVAATLSGLGLAMPRQVVEAQSVQIQFGMVLHAGLLSFGFRSQVEFAPGKELLLRLPFEMATPARTVAAVSLRSHTPSPLAVQLVSHVRALAGTPVVAAADAVRRRPGRAPARRVVADIGIG